MEVNDKLEDASALIISKNELADESCILVENEISTIELNDTLIVETTNEELKNSTELTEERQPAENVIKDAIETQSERTENSTSENSIPQDPVDEVPQEADLEFTVDVNGTTVS